MVVLFFLEETFLVSTRLYHIIQDRRRRDMLEPGRAKRELF